MSNAKNTAATSSYRLPQSVKPGRYEITLEPDMVNFVFSGYETIEVEVSAPVDRFVLNAKDLEIQEAYAYREDGTRLNAQVSLDDENEMATFKFEGTVDPGPCKFFVRFTGTLNDKLKGFYRSIWTDKDGCKHTIATTQFESTDARRAFPCFDEPAFKATFKVKLVVPENLAAVSNGRLLSRTPVVGSRAGTGKVVCDFAETMKMSTYLVAFIVGELEHSDPVWVNGKELKVWCTPGKKHLTEAAVDFASRGLAKLEWYLGIPYPGGDKIDFLALPDFAAGAMENLGAITFRETALLIDKKTATHAELKRVAEVIIHELVHMWFGDLATMLWWTWLWLNESFATFLENYILSLLEPSWNIFDDFGASRAAALRLDSLKSTHPIECPVNHPDEVAELFDLISYEKGCSVLYMIHQYIGFENFRQGVNLYLKRHAYGNAEGREFWQALEDACRANGLDVPVVDIMTRWVETAGHPVISVEETGTDGFIKLTQSHFTFLTDAHDATRTWPIPVHIKVKSADGSVSEQKFMLNDESQTVFVGDKFEHVVVNAGGSGFLRVRYSASLSEKLLAAPQENLAVIERFNLVNDTWSCVRAGLVPATEYLSLVMRFDTEEDPNVWGILLGSIQTLNGLLPESHRPALGKLVHNLVKPTADKLGWTPAEGENSQTLELRGQLIRTLGTIGGDTAVQGKAKELFAAWTKDKTAVDANVLPALVSILAYNGDKEQYEEFFNLMKTAATPQEAVRFLGSLAAFRDPDLLSRSIELTLSEHVRTQDAPSYLLAPLIMNEKSGEAAWDFMRENWDKMVKAYPDNGVVRMAGAVTALDTPELEAEVKEFFATHEVKSGKMAVAQALEQLRINVGLREREASAFTRHIATVHPEAIVAEQPPEPPAS